MVKKGQKKTDAVAPVAETGSVVLTTKDSTKDSTKDLTEKKSRRSKKTVEPEPVMTENVVVENVTVVSDSTGLSENFTEFMAKFQSLVSQMGCLRTEFRSLEKKAMREIKAAQKVSAKRKRKSGNRSPSGFVKPHSY